MTRAKWWYALQQNAYTELTFHAFADWMEEEGNLPYARALRDLPKYVPIRQRNWSNHNLHYAWFREGFYVHRSPNDPQPTWKGPFILPGFLFRALSSLDFMSNRILQGVYVRIHVKEYRTKHKAYKDLVHALANTSYRAT